MKESLSYTFILNIVIVFIFTCFAVVMGILSYYKAFKANSIISQTIEKYEGFNCISREEIARKLNNIGYKAPFNVNCNGKGDGCIADNDFGYVVTSYNLDMPDEQIVYDDERYLYYSGDTKTEGEYFPMNSSYKCNENGCTTNKHYQYGIYTYMYVELPVVSNLLKLSFFSKTNPMYEFRNFYVESKTTTSEIFGTQSYIYFTDIEQSFDNLYSKDKIEDEKLGKATYVKDKVNGSCVIETNNAGETECNFNVDAKELIAKNIMEYYAATSTGEELNALGYLSYHITGRTNSKRTYAIINNIQDKGQDGKWKLDSASSSSVRSEGSRRHKCGFVRDYNDF